MMRVLVLLTMVGGLFASSMAWAVPTKLAQQGRLLDGDGEPLAGSHELEYALFDSSSGGTELWSESQDVGFDDGYYAVQLGQVEPLDDQLLDEPEVWLELAVDGVLLEPRMQLVSVPYALRASSAEHVDGGIVDAAELSVGGQLVVDSDGEWVGPALPVFWGDLIDVPPELADGDADTLAGLACISGQVPAYDHSSGLWVCSSPSGDDTLALLSCTDGQLVTWDAFAGQWQCNDDLQLSEAAVEAFVSNGSIDLAAGSTLAGLGLATTGDLTTSLPWSAITGVPADLANGDSDTLLGLPCADGFVAKYSVLLGAWDCAVDLDTQLSEAQVEGFVTNGAIDLAAGTAVAGAAISTGPHTVDTDTQLSETQVEGFVTNGSIDLAAGSAVAGAAISTGSHTVDTDTQLSEVQVEGFVTNAAIDLAAGSAVGGAPISTGAHTVDSDTQLSEVQVETFVTNGVIDLAGGSQVGGALISTGAHTTNTNLTEGQVEAYIINGPLALATGTTVAGVPISTGAHTINTDTHLSEGQVELFITNAPIGLAAGTTVAGNIISTGAHTTQLPWTSISGIPSDIFDGDGDVLGGLSCSISGQIARFDTSTSLWACDSDAVLSETQVENYISNGAISLGTGSSLNGEQLLSVSSTSQVNPAGDLDFDGSTLFVDSSNDRVGIGTSNPNRTLELTTSDGLRINNSNSGNGGYLEFTNSGDATHTWTLERDNTGGFKVRHDTGFGRGAGSTTSPIFIDNNDQVAVGGALTVIGAMTVVGGVDIYDSSGNQRAYLGPDSSDLAELTTYAATDDSGLITFDTQEGGTPYERMRIRNDGNVGIGTTTPGEKLTVAGTIESTSGGVKFPDGTTQTSAASAGTPSYYTNTGNWGQSSFASCNSGDIMTGGGCESDSNSPAKQNHPSGNGWTCETNSSSTRAHVRCLDL